MPQHTGLHTSAWPLIPQVSNTANRADLKLNQRNLDHRSMFQSIASCWPLLVEIKKEKNKLCNYFNFVLSCPVFSLVLQNVIAMHAGKVLYSSCAGKHGARYKTNFISLKAVLAFQTLMLATLGKWATTHDRVIFLGKNCSWTFLPGST